MDVFFLITHRHEDNMAPTPSTPRNRYSALMNHSAHIFVWVNETHESCPSLPGSYPTEWKIQGRHHHTHSGPSREFVTKSKVPKSSQCLDSVECSRVQCAVWDLPFRQKSRTLISYFPAQPKKRKQVSDLRRPTGVAYVSTMASTEPNLSHHGEVQLMEIHGFVWPVTKREKRLVR